MRKILKADLDPAVYAKRRAYKREWMQQWRKDNPEENKTRSNKYNLTMRLKRQAALERFEESRPGYCSVCGIDLKGRIGQCADHGTVESNGTIRMEREAVQSLLVQREEAQPSA